VRSLSPSQIQLTLSRIKNPVVGNKDTKEEFIFDESEKDNYLVKLTVKEQLSNGTFATLEERFVFYDQMTYEEAQYYHSRSKGGYYAWLNCSIEVLHDPTAGEPKQIDKRSKFKEKYLEQLKIKRS
jgi:hypothetical protein